ncbi:MAG TPA: hypothetical protein VN257_08495, partial [Actinotalea sp.]|nr:hypothetical protein [Actinotalea sp.]
LVCHSGPLLWRTRARAALLHAGPGAALSHDAAGHLHEFIPVPPRIIDVSIPEARRVAPSPGLRIHRRRTFPPAHGRLLTVGRADTVLDILGRAANDDDAIAFLCVAVRARTWPEEILEALGRRPWAHQRGLVLDLLADVAEGIESPLEHRYHYSVERAHGLPTAQLQVRHRLEARWVRADCVYEGLGVRAELDGQLAHPGGRTDDDVWRDNAVLISRDEITLRYRWRHVRVTPCRTAAQVASALRSRGWAGRPHPCGPTCTLP